MMGSPETVGEFVRKWGGALYDDPVRIQEDLEALIEQTHEETWDDAILEAARLARDHGAEDLARDIDALRIGQYDGYPLSKEKCVNLAIEIDTTYDGDCPVCGGEFRRAEVNPQGAVWFITYEDGVRQPDPCETTVAELDEVEVGG